MDGANKYKALEFALKNNNKQVDYLIEHLNIDIMDSIRNKNLTLVKYFIEEKRSDVKSHLHFTDVDIKRLYVQ